MGALCVVRPRNITRTVALSDVVATLGNWNGNCLILGEETKSQYKLSLGKGGIVVIPPTRL